MKKTVEVVAAIIKKENEVFIAKRKNYGELANKWEFPGGKIEPGETKEEALVREIKEELGVDIEVIEFAVANTHEYETFVIKLHTYFSRVIDGEIVLNEHQEYKWVKIEEMREIDFAEADHAIIDFLLNNS